MQAAPNLAVGATAGQNRAHMATGLKLARPVNSWMAFRSYYSTIFAGLQQKAISVFMTFLWQEEPFKGKWAIIAKAYSKVRDAEGKVNAPFDRFLAISAPFVNLVHPRSYLRTYGYEVGIGMVGHTVLRRKVLTDLRGIVGNLNVGVHDVIRNCYNQGYIPKLIDSVLPTNAVALTMATIAQPTQSSSAAAMANGVVVAGNVNGAGQGFLAANGIGSIFGQAVATNVPAVAGNATGAGQGPLGANGTGTIAGEDELDLNAPIPSPVFPVSGQEMDDAAKRAHLKACAALKGPYPFHANFEPGSETAIYAPHRGDPFDAIEISDLHEFDFDFSDWIIDETRK